jgi:hypothetical protein
MKARGVTVGILLFLSGCGQQSAVPVAPADGPKIEPVATVLELHETMISPASDIIFNVGLESPKDDGAWAAVRNNALIPAESGNLLMIEGRAKDTGAWMEMSKAMVKAAMQAQKAAEAKDVEAVSEAGNEIVTVCMRCHEPYRDHRPMLGR